MSATAIEVQLPPRVRVSLIHADGIDREVHLYPYPMGIGAISTMVNRLEYEIGYSPPSSAQVKNERSHTTLLHMFS